MTEESERRKGFEERLGHFDLPNYTEHIAYQCEAYVPLYSSDVALAIANDAAQDMGKGLRKIIEGK